MGSGALFRDGSGRVLLVKPTYKEVWEIPGGVIEPGEAPRVCCRRELHEELGLELEIGRLLVIDWLPPAPPAPDGWMFVFDGGVMLPEVAGRIRLCPDELLEWRFVELTGLDGYVSESKARRLREAHRCAVEGSTADLEWGFLPEVSFGFEMPASDSG
jgi:ADP-ribose pyrophosphatase YjhB (NUDIX family)